VKGVESQAEGQEAVGRGGAVKWKQAQHMRCVCKRSTHLRSSIPSALAMQLEVGHAPVLSQQLPGWWIKGG